MAYRKYFTYKCIPIEVLQLFCWSMTPSHHWPGYAMITHIPLVAGNLPWLLGDGQ